MIGAPSATLLAVIAATWFAWDIGRVVVLLADAAESVVLVVRRRIAVRRVHTKWARFRHEHPEVF